VYIYIKNSVPKGQVACSINITFFKHSYFKGIWSSVFLFWPPLAEGKSEGSVRILWGTRQLYGPAYYKLKHVFIVRRSLRAPWISSFRLLLKKMGNFYFRCQRGDCNTSSDTADTLPSTFPSCKSPLFI